MKILKKILKISSCLLLMIIIVIIFNICITKSKQIETVNSDVDIKLDMGRASSNLSKALQFKTISYTDPNEFDYDEFLKLYNFIDETYPRVKENLSKETIANYSLLYKWEGANKELKSLILCAHMDVVDIEKETLNEWKYEPFSGEIAEGKIWGRGARDNKCQVFSILEAVEYLLESGYKPERTIYLAFGHDEEVLGQNGAANIAKYLEENRVEAECLIDEGGAIVKNAIPGVNQKTALIGVAEKGYMTLKLSAKMDGGHSSDPAKETAVGSVSTAISNIEKYSFDETLDMVEPMFEYAAPEAKLPMNVVYSNLWLTGGVLKNILSSSPETDASIRTTKAVTVFNAGFKDNVIPSEASALINFRLMPGETIEGTKNKVIKIIDNNKINVELYGYYNEAPEMAPIESEAFKDIQKSLKEVFPDCISVPYFVTGGTDSKHYYNITKNIYRVTPSVKEKDEVGHGTNERIPIDNYEEYIKVVVRLIKNI